jgi:hypothetical protein
MEVPLIVVLGAGASRGSANYKRRLRPPLTIDLFNEADYGEQLRPYDLAHQAGRFIDGELTGNATEGLERALHLLRTSEHPHHRHMALAVPPYLQHLLHAVSEAHYTEAFRYDRLIERLLRLPYVCFLTLNYDVLLDRRLNGYHRLSTLDDYITREKNWALIKLHGSVNWFHPAVGRFRATAPPANLQWESDTFHCELPDASLDDIRGGYLDFAIDRYPALAIPEGADDRLVLPSAHISFINQTVGCQPEIDLLVIGYSGLDIEPLKLLESWDCRVRRMTLVNMDYEAAGRVMDRFKAAGIDAVWPNIVHGDFASWADEGGLDQLVDEYDGPYLAS